MNLRSYLPFSRHTRPLHATTYLLGVPLFSISFLVFLNSSLSFLLTNLFSVPASRLGSIVGTLGFVDELVAIVAAPIWGLVSDGRLGTRGVSALGYTAIAVGLVLFVQLQSIYPGLVIGRVVFSLGAAAVTTMVSAILPEMTSPVRTLDADDGGEIEHAAPTGKLAGLVGLFTGLGALIGLGVFLRLPPQLAARPDFTPAQAVRAAYLIVAGVAALVALWCALGLPPPRNTDTTNTWRHIKSWIWTRVWGGDPSVYADDDASAPAAKNPDVPRGVRGLWAAATVAFDDGRIGVAYVGGFVARASSVGISLFLPLYVNHYFVSTGRCTPSDVAGERGGCRRAYILAATLTGTSQLTALLLAPVFGWLTDRCAAVPSLRTLPLILSAALGIAGFTLFSLLPSPESRLAFFYAALTGASQIGAIVSSLGLLSQGVVEVKRFDPGLGADDTLAETDPLLARALARTDPNNGREAFKGCIAGVYSLSGAAAILLLTKAGGAAFDRTPSAPFWMLAGFNALLAVVAVGNGVAVGVRERRRVRI